ncbi:MAG: SPOR domain-containing protein, partial [Bacteroidales bacterium]
MTGKPILAIQSTVHFALENNDTLTHQKQTINKGQYHNLLKKALTKQKVIDSLSVVLDKTYKKYYDGNESVVKMKLKQEIRSLNKQIHSLQEEILPLYTAARDYEETMDTSVAVAGIMDDTLRPSLFSISPVTARDKSSVRSDVVLPSGLTYRIQLGAYSNKMGASDFHGISPVMAEKIPGKPLIRYYAGIFFSYHQAKSALEKVRAKGFKDAYIVSYIDGMSIPLDRAIKIGK